MHKKPSKTLGRKANRRFAEARLLECGHPGLPNNLQDGKCGTCQCADEWDSLAKETKDVDLKALTLKIANCFRNGTMIYDKNGKTLMEIEAASRPHSNEKLTDAAVSDAGKHK